MKIAILILSVAIVLAFIAGLIAVILEIRHGVISYEIMAKVCWMIIGLLGMVIALLAYLSK